MMGENHCVLTGYHGHYGEQRRRYWRFRLRLAAATVIVVGLFYAFTVLLFIATGVK